MKKLVTFSVLVAGLFSGASAFATDICLGGVATNGATIASGTAGTNYMMRPIAAKCSANTFVIGADGTSGAWYSIGSASVKGKNSFKGHTNGGAVSVSVPCAIQGGCTKAEATTAQGVAHTAAAAT
jgi:hypothetical protein